MECDEDDTKSDTRRCLCCTLCCLKTTQTPPSHDRPCSTRRQAPITAAPMTERVQSETSLTSEQHANVIDTYSESSISDDLSVTPEVLGSARSGHRVALRFKADGQDFRDRAGEPSITDELKEMTAQPPAAGPIFPDPPPPPEGRI
ncbi:uncharacterized protein LOC143299085 [Babylonia areolata]|uniref:uncharacterized protein LOC143299085 n=1 Tax=Babylonia areolata TaxID=304850 RepID=UPI003FD69B33